MSHPLDSVHNSSSLADLQGYMREVIKLRGFDADSWEYVSVILAEELGELLKSLRKLKALPPNDLRHEEHRGWVRDEFADLFTNLLDLANRFDYDLLEAFIIKQRKDIERFGI